MADSPELTSEVRIILNHRAVLIKWDNHGSPVRCGLCNEEFVLGQTWITRSVNPKNRRVWRHAEPTDCPKIDQFGYTEWDEKSAVCANRIYEVKRKRAGHHASC